MDAKINDLASKLAAARLEEKLAREARIKIEEMLIVEIGIGEKERKTINTDNGLKVIIQSGLNYKLDKEYDDELVPTKVNIKHMLDVEAYEDLREYNPQRFAEVSKYVTTTAKKISISLQVA